MPSWSLTADDPLSLNLAADARLGETDYTDDQIWELSLGGGEPPALALETTYGLRAQRMRIFPRFILGDNQYADPAGFHGPPRMVCFYPNYLALTFQPFEGLEVLAEYWILSSQVAAGRLRFVNQSILPLNLRLELVALLIPGDRQGSLSPIDLGAGEALGGETANLYPVIYLTGAPRAAAGPYPALALDMEMYPGNTRFYTWAAAGLRDQQQSLEAARQATTRSWDAEATRLELLHRSQAVLVETGNPEWDAAFAMTQKSAFELFLHNRVNLPHPSFTLTRRPDQGYSARGDGADFSLPWAGQTALDTTYLASLLLPGAPDLVAGLLRNFLAVQDADGRIDWRPGMGGQRTRRLAQPLLASLAVQLAPYMAANPVEPEPAPAAEAKGFEVEEGSDDFMLSPEPSTPVEPGEPAADVDTITGDEGTVEQEEAKVTVELEVVVGAADAVDRMNAVEVESADHSQPGADGEPSVECEATPDRISVDPGENSAETIAGIDSLPAAVGQGSAVSAAQDTPTQPEPLPSWYVEVYPGLLRFFQAWFSPERDADGDGIPEWDNALQSGLDDSPVFDRFSPEGRGTDANCIESPALTALLFRECTSLIEIAEALGPAAHDDLPMLRDAQERLRRGLDETWDARAGIYRYRDYASHLSLPGMSVISFQGTGEFSAKRRFKQPRRLVVRLEAFEERTYAALMTISGYSPEGEASETLSPRDFAWLGSQAHAVTHNTYLAIERVEVQGIGDRDRARIFAPDLTQEDCSLLLPLWAGAPTPAQARRLVESTLLGRFRKKYGIALAPGQVDSISLPWNYLLGEGLLRYGYRDEAADLVQRLMAAIVPALKQQHTFRQSYHAASGQPAGERGHLHGLAPLGLYLHTLGIRYLSPHLILLDGFNPYSTPVTVQYRKVVLVCHRERTEITFAGGQQITMDRPGLHRIVLC